ncbi:MAG TPA: tRNA (adenosine(37)-N6)-threonylcarbamoyltransferase complex transferase subunit TsaD [Thermodesulfatator sp.]|nr:tRNA (adenosine(37)-N6)-threonylcarbamoyltransferase complex transferase subunit TsaD [Thermodesulfatator sp.]
MMLILAIESSCDETAAAVVEDGRRALSSVVASQNDLHGHFGGVVPELASRRHLEMIVPVVDEALARAGVGLKEITGLAVTQGPGLVGALVVGFSFAKALAMARGLPLVGVDHLHAHLLAVFLEAAPSFPFVALVVSGGHTNLYLVDDFLTYRLLGQTRDDAAGEAFDKVAKLLELGYPGGPIISQIAQKGNPQAIPLPRARVKGAPLDFSFSGLKTAVVHYVRRVKAQGEPLPLADLCASFETAVVEMLVERTLLAVEQTGVKTVVLAGGVAANPRLRKTLKAAGRERGLEVFTPSPALCTDNAAMVGVAGYHLHKAGRLLDLEADVYARAKTLRHVSG